MNIGWSIHRHSKGSGKSRGSIIATGMSEYACKTTVNDANKSETFQYYPVDPSGVWWKLFGKEWHAINWKGEKIAP